MKKRRPTDVRKAEDVVLAKKLMKKHNYARYDASFNPYEEGTLRSDRLKRNYVRDRKKFLETDILFRDLCDMHGTVLPDKPWQGVEI